MKALLSPLHDLNTDVDGCIKKPHHHVILIVDDPITKKRVDKII